MSHAHVVEKYQESKVDGGHREDSDLESLLELLENLENDDDLAAIRETRLAELQKEFRQIDRAVDDLGDSAGTVLQTTDEKELMATVAATETAIVHFYEPEFARCQAMNSLLRIFAEKHLPIRVVAIEAHNAPFLVSKLRVKVLPLVVAYRLGQEKCRLVGFEAIGGSEHAASLATLESFLLGHGVIARTTTNAASVHKRPSRADTEDSDDDWC